MFHLIDTHCHLDMLEQAPVEELMKRADVAGVRQAIAIGAGTGTASPERCTKLAREHKSVFAAVGIHPQEAAKFQDLDSLRPFLTEPKVVAIGETGLDFHRDWGSEQTQQEVFERTVLLAKEFKKPLIIHCRDVQGSNRAAEIIMEILTRYKVQDIGGVFHCYPGHADFAKRLRELNFLVSFPGVLTFKSAHAVREIAKAIPLDQIMLETDAPYMAPEPFRGKPSEPAHVRQIAEKLSEVKGIRVEEIALQTTANAQRLFGLPPIF